MAYADYTSQFSNTYGDFLTLSEGSWVFPTYGPISNQSPVGGWEAGLRPAKLKIIFTASEPVPYTQIELFDSSNNKLAGDEFSQIYPSGTNEIVFDITFLTDDLVRLKISSYAYISFSYKILLGDDSVVEPPPCGCEHNTLTGNLGGATTMDFEKISSTLRVPGAYIEIDGSQAGLNSGSIPNLLLVGQKLATGTAVAGEIVMVGSLANAIIKAGAGSMLAQMAKRFYAINPSLNLFLLPFADNASGAAATATLEVTAVATCNGTLAIYLGGILISVAITTTMTTAQIATAINDAINAVDAADNSLPALATVTASTVTLTAKHKSTAGNAIDVRINALSGDIMPAGLAITLTGFSGGTLIPTAINDSNIAAIFDADDSGFLLAPSKYIALGLNDDVTMAAFHAESQRRYAPPIQSGFRAFAAFSGTYEDAITYGSTKNYEHISCVALGGGMTTVWETAAIVAATAAPALYDNPVRSLEGRALKGLRMAQAFPFNQANALLYGGLSLVQKSRDGSVSIKRLISMYLHRPDDSLDDAYLDINTTEVMERIRYEQRMGAIQRFTGKAVARNDEGYRPGLPIITLDTVRAYLLTMYKDTLLRDKGWVQDYEYYKSTLILEQDPTNPSRFNYIDQPVILSPFYILAGRAQFRKEV